MKEHRQNPWSKFYFVCVCVCVCVCMCSFYVLDYSFRDRGGRTRASSPEYEKKEISTNPECLGANV